ncbi:MAG: hypothetical protein RLZZ338_3962 [Cyanobacteriota bacterium]|jgi:hypothetical protein
MKKKKDFLKDEETLRKSFKGIKIVLIISQFLGRKKLDWELNTLS